MPRVATLTFNGRRRSRSSRSLLPGVRATFCEVCRSNGDVRGRRLDCDAPAHLEAGYLSPRGGVNPPRRGLFFYAGTNRRFTTRQKHRDRSPMGKQYGQSLESPRAEAGEAPVPFGGLSSAVTAPRAKAGRRLAHAPKDQSGTGEHPRRAPFEEDSRRQRTYPREGQPREERIWNG